MRQAGGWPLPRRGLREDGAVALDVSISFVKAVTGGALVAEAREEAVSARVSTCLVRVSDGAGALVALFKGTAYRKAPPDADGGQRA
jgi:acyl-CoA thioesterase